MREHLVEERLSVGKRKLLGLAQELFPSGSVECGTQAVLILFGESDSAGVEVSEQLREFRGNGPGLRRGHGRSGRRCPMQSARPRGDPPVSTAMSESTRAAYG